MNGLYRIPLNPEEKPEDNPRVKALLRAIDPGAAVTIACVEGKLKNGRMRGDVAERYCEIRATGGAARKLIADAKTDSTTLPSSAGSTHTLKRSLASS
jgi:hypothetical protein